MIVYVQQTAGAAPWVINVADVDTPHEARSAVNHATPDELRRVFAVIEGGRA